jgi:hypothetical protein
LKPGAIAWYSRCGFTAVLVANGDGTFTFLHSDNERWWPTGRPVKLDPGSEFLKPENHAFVWEP